jgi:hypothetical protein
MKTDKTDKLEITEDMYLEEKCYIKVHNEKVEFLEKMKCFSVYTPNMDIGDVDRCEYTGMTRGKTMVMLELPTELIHNSIEVSKELNDEYEQLTGQSLGLTPLDILKESCEYTDLHHNPHFLIEDYKDNKKGELFPIRNFTEYLKKSRVEV